MRCSISFLILALVLASAIAARRTAMDLSIAQEVIRVAQSARRPVVALPTMGATVPRDAFERPL